MSLSIVAHAVPSGKYRCWALERDPPWRTCVRSLDGVAGRKTRGQIDGADRLGAVASAALPTDGILAKYALLHGTVLRFNGADLVRADQTATVLCDGDSIAIRAPGGTRLECRKLTAATLRINGLEVDLPSGDMPVIIVPPLPNEWTINYLRDGQVVTVAGDGPRPLKIQAPEARELVINGVPRHFIRSERLTGEGWI